MTRVAVLGPGAVGGFLAGALARGGAAVTVVAREDTARAIARDGLEVESVRLGTFTAYPSAVARLEQPADVLVIAVKAPALEAALERVAAEPGLVVPLLNGVEHLDVLRARFGPRAVAGSIRIAAERPAAGRIVHTSAGVRVDLAPPYPAVDAFADALRLADVPVQVGERVPDVLWGKLARLNALASTTSAADAPIGTVRTHPRWRVALQDAVDETAAVAVAEGARVDAGATLQELMDLGPDHDSSLHRDLAAGVPSELDAICGAVLRAAARHGIPTPALEGLVAAIRDRYPHA